MYLLTTPAFLSMSAIVVLALQGVSILRRAKQVHDRWLGRLTLLLAVLGLGMHTLFFTNMLVLSPEFGLVMVQGNAGRIGLLALLVGLALGLAMSQSMVRQAAGQSSNARRLLLLGLAVGVVSAWRLLPLNAGDMESPTIYAYNLWLPSLLIWLLGSLLEVAFNILRWPRHVGGLWRFIWANPRSPRFADQWRVLLRAWIETFAITLLALWVLFLPALNDAISAYAWVTVLMPVLTANVVLSTWLLICLAGTTLRYVRVPVFVRVPFIGIVTLIGVFCGLIIAGVFLGTASLGQEDIQLSSRLPHKTIVIVRLIDSAVWLGFPTLLFGVLGVRKLLLARRAGRRVALPWPPQLPNGRQGFLLLALTMLSLSIVAILFDVNNIGPAVALTCFVLAWLLLTEVVTDGLLHRGMAQVRAGKLRAVAPAIRSSGTYVWDGLYKGGKGVAARMKKALSLPSATIAVAKTLVAIVLLVALSEIANTGRTVFQPFKAYGVPDNVGLGQVVSDRVINAIDKLNQNLQPPIILPDSNVLRGSNGADNNNKKQGEGKYLTVGGMAGSVDVTLAQKSDIEIPGVKIPLGLLVAPIQRPMRWLLGVRMIDGSVQVDRDAYKLLVSSSGGETWVASFPQPHTEVNVIVQYFDRSQQRQTVPLVFGESLLAQQPGVITSTTVLPNETAKLNVRRAGSIGAEQVSVSLAPESADGVTGPIFFVMDDNGVIQVVNNPTRADAVDALADEIAFKIISSNSTLAATGMTNSWEAFLPFKQGLDSYQRFSELGDMDALTRSIAHFRTATQKDPTFALAQYRLGLALERDGQPGAAATAFRASLANNPRFAATYNALAYDLYFYDQNYLPTAAAMRPVTLPDPFFESARITETIRLWQNVLKLPDQLATAADRASAYYGLCTDALDQPNRSGLLDKQAIQDSYNLAYFYCQQAERQYAALSSELRSVPGIKKGEASALNAMALILLESQIKFDPVEKNIPWHCGAYTIQVESDGRISRSLPRSAANRNNKQALHYFERALALQPNDIVLQCNAAHAAYILNDENPMKILEENIQAHLALADSYTDDAKQRMYQADYSVAARYYQLALDEYQAVINRDPTNVDALNGYAYTFWQQRVQLWSARLSDKQINGIAPTNEIAQKAKDYADEAVRLTADKVPKADAAMFHSTLGEVLIGVGKLEKAIPVLEAAVAPVPDHPLYDEIRWDLAIAKLCAGQADVGEPYTVKELLTVISTHEERRESQPFTRQGLLDELHDYEYCLAIAQEGSQSVQAAPTQ